LKQGTATLHLAVCYQTLCTACRWMHTCEAESCVAASNTVGSPTPAPATTPSYVIDQVNKANRTVHKIAPLAPRVEWTAAAA
jgi:hypothetical protein